MAMASFLFLAAIAAADRPGELSSMVLELTRTGCEDQLLDALHEAVGRERSLWIQSQSVSFETKLRPLAIRPGLDDARYALHRVFVDARGWYVNGLEESKIFGNTSAPLQSLLQGELPVVEAAFEKCPNLGIRELALLAATLDELVHQEVLQRVKAVFKAKKLPLFGHIVLEELQKVLEQVMIGYICDASGITADREKYVSGELDIHDRYPDWPNLQRFLRSIQEVVLPTQSKRIDFDDLTNIVKELTEHYGRWQNGECQVLSDRLKSLEGQCPGRVNLAKFYSSHLYQDNWQFTESMAYLKSLGALEDSKGNPKLITVNYVLGANNCVSTSKFYSQCCVNQCDIYLRNLEKAVAKPEVSPEDLQAAVRAVLPEPYGFLDRKLHQIAQDGKVSLHGSAFTEWMHHAYPRECPALKLRDMPEELAGHFESRSGSSASFSDEDMKTYLEIHDPDAASDCRIPWATELLIPRRLQEAEAAISTQWVWACAGMMASSLLAFALLKAKHQSAEECLMA